MVLPTATAHPSPCARYGNLRVTGVLVCCRRFAETSAPFAERNQYRESLHTFDRRHVSRNVVIGGRLRSFRCNCAHTSTQPSDAAWRLQLHRTHSQPRLRFPSNHRNRCHRAFVHFTRGVAPRQRIARGSGGLTLRSRRHAAVPWPGASAPPALQVHVAVWSARGGRVRLSERTLGRFATILAVPKLHGLLAIRI